MVKHDFPTPPPPTTTSLYSRRNYRRRNGGVSGLVFVFLGVGWVRGPLFPRLAVSDGWFVGTERRQGRRPKRSGQQPEGEIRTLEAIGHVDVCVREQGWTRGIQEQKRISYRQDAVRGVELDRGCSLQVRRRLATLPNAQPGCG